MLEINWEQDYQDDFICPSCEKSRLRLCGFHEGIKNFRCHNCNTYVLASIKLSGRFRCIKPSFKDEHIDWEKDYHGEFVCSNCNKRGMSVGCIHKKTNKRQFRCSSCKKIEQASYDIDKIKRVEDPLNLGVIWYTNHRIKDFICAKCQDYNIYFTRIDNHNKKQFACRTCKSVQYESIIITTGNFNRFSNDLLPVKTFNWRDDEWDLRAINPKFNDLDSRYFHLHFSGFELTWYEDRIKDYVWYLCKLEKSLATIHRAVSNLRIFSKYLSQEHTSGFDTINRDVILDYLANDQKVNKSKLGTLRNFFRVGSIKSWFNIDPDIIRDADYPKYHRGNPDPISNTVRKQIEENLHLLPDPIARMWLIGYFSAMRPSELALLKQDCLVREGQYWKLVWQRKKTNDQHEIPISRTIAQVVQEQQEYIKDLWGEEWDYLFCHYHNLSRNETSQPKLEAVKRVIPSSNKSPLLTAIRTLVKALDIRDENGQLAKFQSKLLRPTRLTELFEQGHDLAVVSAWAGHKQFATTSIYYTQVSCELMEREAGHIQKALVDNNGHRLAYESFPKSFWENPTAHKLELGDTHINTPIYGYCGLPLDQDCHKFRACYTCQSFVATIEKLPEYINVRDELRGKQAKAMLAGQEVLVEQFGTQADRLDEIIAGLHQEAA
jgi:integrase/transcription elongation factor Elf1